MFFANRKFKTVDDVPDEYFKEKKSIYAFVERVIDGDTIRVSHVPDFRPGQPAPLPLQQQRGIAKDTLSIRIYAVDTPELAKKNKNQTSQPFAEEAKQFTENLVLHQMVEVTLLRKDQYRRAISAVETVRSRQAGSSVGGLLDLLSCCLPKVFSNIGTSGNNNKAGRDLSVELAEQGLAELYTGGGAEYHNNRKLIEQKIALAKRDKRGIWSLENRTSAAQYKQAKKNGARQ